MKYDTLYVSFIAAKRFLDRMALAAPWYAIKNDILGNVAINQRYSCTFGRTIVLCICFYITRIFFIRQSFLIFDEGGISLFGCGIYLLFLFGY